MTKPLRRRAVGCLFSAIGLVVAYFGGVLFGRSMLDRALAELCLVRAVLDCEHEVNVIQAEMVAIELICDHAVGDRALEIAFRAMENMEDADARRDAVRSSRAFSLQMRPPKIIFSPIDPSWKCDDQSADASRSGKSEPVSDGTKGISPIK